MSQLFSCDDRRLRTTRCLIISLGSGADNFSFPPSSERERDVGQKPAEESLVLVYPAVADEFPCVTHTLRSTRTRIPFSKCASKYSVTFETYFLLQTSCVRSSSVADFSS